MSLFLSALPDPQGFLTVLRDQLPPGARVVASTIRPDADLSKVVTQLLEDLSFGRVPPIAGMTLADSIDAVRDYVNSAAWLLRLEEEGTFRFYDEVAFRGLFENAGFVVDHTQPSFGPPYQAWVLRAYRGD